VVLFMIAAATALACMLLAVLLRRRVFDEFGRPRVECITRE
jgi:ABC-type iron transport system FetAB permease component